MTQQELIDKGFDFSQINLILKLDRAGIKGLTNLTPNAFLESIRKFKNFAEKYNTNSSVNAKVISAINANKPDFLDFLVKFDPDFEKNNEKIGAYWKAYNNNIDISKIANTTSKEELMLYIKYQKEEAIDISHLLNRNLRDEQIRILKDCNEEEAKEVTSDMNAGTTAFVRECHKKSKIIRADKNEIGNAKYTTYLKALLNDVDLYDYLDINNNGLKLLAEGSNIKECAKLLRDGYSSAQVRTFIKLNKNGIDYTPYMHIKDATVLNMIACFSEKEPLCAKKMLENNYSDELCKEIIKLYNKSIASKNEEIYNKKIEQFINALYPGLNSFNLEFLVSTIENGFDITNLINKHFNLQQINTLIDGIRKNEIKTQDDLDFVACNQFSARIMKSIICLRSNGIDVNTDEFLAKNSVEVEEDER